MEEAQTPEAAIPPLTVALTRGPAVESVHLVHVAVTDGRGRLRAWAGDPHRRAFWRSAAKPVQAMPVVLSGAADAFGLGPRELAVACGSHEGAAAHQETVAALLRRAGLDEGALQCGVQLPSEAQALAEALRSGGPRRIHNNCSGKHAGMLAVCVHRGWPLEYLGRTHPLQQWIRALVASLAGEEPLLGVDGCGVPTFALSLAGMATAYARLAHPVDLPPDEAAAARRLAAAMAEHPEMVSGVGQPNTAMLARCGQRVLTKGGAEGVWCAGWRGRAGGLGIAVKVQDGGQRAAVPAMLALWVALRWVPADDPILAPFLAPPVRNTRDEVVGALQVELPQALREALEALATGGPA